MSFLGIAENNLEYLVYGVPKRCPLVNETSIALGIFAATLGYISV